MHSKNSSISKMPTFQKSVSLKSKTNRFEDIDKVVSKLKLHQKMPSISPQKKLKSPGGNNAGINF